MRKRVKSRVAAGLLVALLAGLLLMPSCATTVVPPADPPDPVEVLLVDHGKHASLVMPRHDGTRVQYAYGDWDYFALNKTGVGSTLSAALWPTQGALGRHELPRDRYSGDPSRHYSAEKIVSIMVSRKKVDALLSELDGIYEANIESKVRNDWLQLDLVHAPEKYTALHNSNGVAARWLEQLGCKVSGSRLFSSWNVKPPPGESPP
jgi:hypothetical protein